MIYFASFGLGLPLGVAVLVWLAILLILVFEIAMFIDVIRNRHISSERKLLWVIGMLLIHPIIAVIYYFTDHKEPA